MVVSKRENDSMQRKITHLQREVSDLREWQMSMTEWKSSIDKNTETMERMIDIFKTAKSGGRFLSAVGNGLKWLALTGASIVAVWGGAKLAFKSIF
jgi:hypothetical protein